MPDVPTLPSPDSQTHRLCFFPHTPHGTKYFPVPHFVADEVEALREFVRFLYPQRGQDRFKLNRPDILDPRWTVSSKADGETPTYTAGETPLLAVRAARHRLAAELEGERVMVPFSLPKI